MYSVSRMYRFHYIFQRYRAIFLAAVHLGHRRAAGPRSKFGIAVDGYFGKHSVLWPGLAALEPSSIVCFFCAMILYRGDAKPSVRFLGLDPIELHSPVHRKAQENA